MGEGEGEPGTAAEALGLAPLLCPACAKPVLSVIPIGAEREEICVCHSCWLALHYSRCFSHVGKHGDYQERLDAVVKDCGLVHSRAPPRKSNSLQRRTKSGGGSEYQEEAREVQRKKHRVVELMIGRAIRDYSKIDAPLKTARGSEISAATVMEPPLELP